MDAIWQFYLPFSLVLSSLTTRSFRRRVHSAHFPIFSQKHLASELSVANSRDISVDALCSPFIHRNVVVRYSPRIRSRNHARGNIEIVLYLVLSRAVHASAMLRGGFLVFIFLEIRSSAHNCGRQFSNGITKKKKHTGKREGIRRKAGSRGILPPFLDRLRSSVSLSIPISHFSRWYYYSAPQFPEHSASSNNFHSISYRFSYILLSFSSLLQPTGPVLSSNFTPCQNSFTWLALSQSETCEENWYCRREKVCFSRCSGFYCLRDVYYAWVSRKSSKFWPLLTNLTGNNILETARIVTIVKYEWI